MSSKTFPKGRLLGVVGASMSLTLVVSACGGGDSAPADGGGRATTKITVAVPFPDPLITSTFELGKAKGWHDEDNIEVEVLNADDPRAAVAGGSADVAIVNAGAALEARDAGLGTKIVGGFFCRSSFQFAFAPEIGKPEDLAGKDVAIAGTAGDPAEFQRRRVLAEEGWDLEQVGAKAVYPGPDSTTWVEFFAAGRVVMTPFFGSDRAKIDEAGGVVRVQEMRPWPNFVQIDRKSVV